LSLLCAKNPENVESFLTKLAVKMRILQKKEMDLLLQYKKDEVILYFCGILALRYCGTHLSLPKRNRERSVRSLSACKPSPIFKDNWLHYSQNNGI